MTPCPPSVHTHSHTHTHTQTPARTHTHTLTHTPLPYAPRVKRLSTRPPRHLPQNPCFAAPHAAARPCVCISQSLSGSAAHRLPKYARLPPCFHRALATRPIHKPCRPPHRCLLAHHPRHVPLAPRPRAGHGLKLVQEGFTLAHLKAAMLTVRAPLRHHAACCTDVLETIAGGSCGCMIHHWIWSALLQPVCCCPCHIAAPHPNCRICPKPNCRGPPFSEERLCRQSLRTSRDHASQAVRLRPFFPNRHLAPPGLDALHDCRPPRPRVPRHRPGG
jgi:hypothetical protein